ELEARVRRVDLIDDDRIEDFFDERVGDDVVSARHFDRWWKQERGKNPDLLDLDESVLRLGNGARDKDGERVEASIFTDYPDVLQHGDLALPLTYRFDPGGPLDGVTVHVTASALNQLGDEGWDWHVPGHRDEIVAELVRTLP